MRKLFIATLLLTIGCGTPAFAATQCESIQADTCDATAGCYLEVNNNTCQPCPNGTYKGAGDTSCLSCGDNLPVTWNKNITGLTSQSECAYTTTCPAYHYFGGYTTGCARCSALNDSQTNTYYYGTKTTEYEVTGTVGNDASNLNDACAKCGNNSKTNEEGTGCQCLDGYHVQGGTNDDNTNCAPNEYTITYIANNGTNDTKTQTVQYSTTVSTLPASTFSYKGHKLSKWENKDKKLQIEPGNSFTYDILGNLELTAVWAGKEFTVTYNVGAASCSNLSDQTCRYNDQNCKAQDVESCQYSGYVFRGWKCTSGCENNNETIDPGANISTKSGGADMTLTAIWEQCPAGYYCLIDSPKTSEKCPAGSTSDAGSDQIYDCHMTGGTTKICDKNNDCFTLPAAVGNIFYHGTQQ